MQTGVFRLAHNLEVFWIVVSLVVVNVMDDFTGYQWAAEHLFRDNPMFVPTAKPEVCLPLATAAQRFPRVLTAPTH